MRVQIGISIRSYLMNLSTLPPRSVPERCRIVERFVLRTVRKSVSQKL